MISKHGGAGEARFLFDCSLYGSQSPDMNNPYQSPQPDAGAAIDETVPAAIKPFGILHIIFGALGIITVVIGVLSSVFQKTLLELSSAGNSKIIEQQIATTQKMAPATYIGYVMTLILAFLLLRSGIALVKQREGAVQKSNQYAVASLIAKVVGLLLAFFITMPAMNEMYAGMVDPGVPGSVDTMKFARIGAAVGAVATPVLSCIYPILALVMLNRKPVKQFLEVYGK